MSTPFYNLFEKVFEIVRGNAGGLEGWSDQPPEAQPLPEIVPGAAAGEAQPLEAGSAGAGTPAGRAGGIAATAPGAAHDQQQRQPDKLPALPDTIRNNNILCNCPGLLCFSA